MRGWITSVMLVTFLSGGVSGFVTGRASAPEPIPKTSVDYRIEDLQRVGVTREADLERAREIYERYFERVKALKGEVEHLFKDRIRVLATDTEGQIREILDTYPELSGPELTGTEPSSGAKER